MCETRLTRLLDIRHPIVQGGMAWVSRHQLAAAVSEAGGLGVLGAATMEPAELRAEIEAVRGLTNKPFAVNVPLVIVRPDGCDIVEDLIAVILEEKVPVVITGAGSPDRFTTRLQSAGSSVFHVVPSARLAKKSEAAGCNAVIAESQESGGHIRGSGLSTFSLIPQVVDSVAIPVIAAGGIIDGRGIAAALALGADGAQMGTRFLATTECNAHANYKNAVLTASDEGTLVYGRHRATSRALDTDIVRRLVEMEADSATPEALDQLRGRDRARQGCIEGDLQQGICPSGSAVGSVNQILPVAELIDELVRECHAAGGTLKRLPPASKHE